jgi:GNAT superfamily N-acetyltransferase
MSGCVLAIGGGLTYREVPADEVVLDDPFMIDYWRDRPKRAFDAQLWLEGEARPVSYLAVVPYRMRFGAEAIAVEGIGGVATAPGHRRRGFARTLLEQVLARAVERVPAVVLNGIADFYGAVGFAAAWPKTHFTVSPRALTGAFASADLSHLRLWNDADRAGAAELYNRLHALRPSSAVRESTFAGPARAWDWAGGEAAVVAADADRLRGYAIWTPPVFGRDRPFEIRELSALDRPTTESLARFLADRALDAGHREIAVFEPADSPTGRMLRWAGATLISRFDRGAGWMMRILDRGALIRALRPELARRAGKDDATAIGELVSGALIADDQRLSPLLTGHQSFDDAVAAGLNVPADRASIAERWFPGGGTARLPQPFLHYHDRY